MAWSASVSITIPHGESIECIYYYRSTPPVPPPVTQIPTLRDGMLAALALLLLGLALPALRQRSR